MFKKQKGFGSISALSVVLFLLFGGILVVGIRDYIASKAEAEQKAEFFEREIKKQEKAINELRASAERSQQGLKEVERQSDAAVEDAKKLAGIFEQIQLARLAAETPEEAQEIINEITRNQLDDLRELSQKDWVPNLLDGED